jgi:hypothetical protein
MHRAKSTSSQQNHWSLVLEWSSFLSSRESCENFSERGYQKTWVGHCSVVSADVGSVIEKAGRFKMLLSEVSYDGGIKGIEERFGYTATVQCLGG